jgi:uncharacterized circularly permuted ATP-grasp superfamily protein/uncharacterized alpha-E superfamily protein
MSIFDTYLSQSSFDEMFDKEKNVRPHWEYVYNQIKAFGLDTLKSKQAEIDWHLDDNGVTYNIYNNPEGNNNRPWSLDPIPFIVSEEDWAKVRKGLKQRAKLLNLIFKDIYGEQKLIKENIIPAEVIFGHKGYSPEVYNFGLKENYNLYFYAADLARGPNGNFWVINDKTQAPSGLGYALENRLTLNVISKELYPDIDTRKLFIFIEEYKNLIKELTNGEMDKAVLLTPGAHNETYFEHSFLSSFLEINLVQGNDLLSKNGSIWLKSLSGLKKINTILRRVDDRYCDPLELKNDSKLGVAGLIEATRQENLNVINPIGSAIMENLGLNPFMEAIAKYFLDEELLLPQIATWWCGQSKELEYVLENMSSLIIKKIDRTEDIETYFCKRLSLEQKEVLKKQLLKNPTKYVAQEEISFSTTPYYKNGKIEPRNAVVRAYAIKTPESYSVMNGGLVRVSTSKDTFMVSSQKGGTSKDLWILGKKEQLDNVLEFKHIPHVDISINNIPTLQAENLYWLGRYLARAIATARMIRYTVKKLTNFYRSEDPSSKETQRILQNALTHLTMTYPGFLEEDEEKAEILQKNPMKEILSLIKERDRQGSLSFTISMLANATVNVKNLLAIESWKVFDKLNKDWNNFIQKPTTSNRNLVSELDKLLVYLSSYKELVEESMFKEQGLVLYDIGFKMESALLLISKTRSMMCLKLDKSSSYDTYEAILNSSEIFNAYRAIYKSSLLQENIVEFLLLNTQFPKSLTFLTNKLLADFKTLPKAKTYLTNYEEPIFRAYTLLKLNKINEILQLEDTDTIYKNLDDMLGELMGYFIDSTQELSKTYFSHYGE